MGDFPTFNPDFNFTWTILHVDFLKLPIWDEFKGSHKVSQLSLTSNKNLPEEIVEAKFAFNEGARWIQQKFDP